jgi:salicylate hydroxylase
VSDEILISGGGVGGLTTALALAQKGISARVFEQAREFGAIGYGIQLGPNAFHMFDELGITDAIMEVADCPTAAVWFDAYSGEEVTRVDTTPDIRSRFKHPYIIIHRVDLHNVLLDACREWAVEFAPASPVTGFEDHGDGVTVRTADGGHVDGLALVGADGLRSRVRAQLFGEQEPRFIGWVAHRTIVPMDRVPPGVPRDIVGLWGGAGFHIVHYPLRHGTLFNVVTVFRTPTYLQKVDAATLRAELEQTYAKVHPAMKALIAITDFEWRGPVADRDPIHHWHKGNVVLLGDAAHPTLQSLAQGGCMALEDGVGLAALISLFAGDFPAAFRHFEQERVARTARVTLESRYMWKMFHPEGAERERVHRRFRAMSRDEVWNALAWLYGGYSPPAGLMFSFA